jgi:hypothetical protein
MSVAVMESTTVSEFLLITCDVASEARTPVTTTPVTAVVSGGFLALVLVESEMPVADELGAFWPGAVAGAVFGELA